MLDQTFQLPVPQSSEGDCFEIPVAFMQQANDTH